MGIPAELIELNNRIGLLNEQLATFLGGGLLEESWLGRHRLETIRDRVLEQADLVQALYQAIDGGLTNKATILNALGQIEGHLRAGASAI